ncbi:MAG: PASTA domain-containing protein [Spirochaetaceae bacterium]|nr:PASTA domain-containing protein [Spirochaetaceae bacterium]
MKRNKIRDEIWFDLSDGTGRTGWGGVSPRLFFGFCVAIFILAALIAVVVFFLSVRGAEEVMVPDVQNKELTAALIELQNKELYPRIQLRFSQSAADRGLILEQEPKAGSIVKAGRRIRLVVSQGVLISAIGAYVGRSIDDVRSELRDLFGGSDIPLISIREPLLYQYSSETPGTILEQSPTPGTGISEHTEISLVVSRGPDSENLEMPLLMGLQIEDALIELQQSGVRYEFELRPASSRASAETIVAQDPAGGDAIPTDRIARITVAAPSSEDLNSGEVYALFNHKLPENPYPMQTVLEVILPSGERETLSRVNFKGGLFTHPYRLPRGSILVLSILSREIYREPVE